MIPSPSLRILLIDDDIDDCMFFKDALSETGLNTTLQIATKCTNIMEVIGGELDKLPSLIFLDLNMPLMSGHECLEVIRGASYLNHVPVIIYSTSAIKQEVESTFNGGANLYLQKPSSFQLLVIALKKILQLDWKNSINDRDRNNFIFKHLSSQQAA
jgi:CheY-like chemotaxis protein